MSAAKYDVVIIGGGHNGLTCGAYLARAGKKVLVLERRSIVGGAAVTEEFAPGFRTSTFSYVMSILHPKIIRELELRELGLTVLPATDMFCPIGTDDYIIFSGDVAKTAEQFGRFSKHDGAIYAEFDAWLNEAADYMRRFLLETPVDLSKRDFRSLRKTFDLVWRYRKIGNKLYDLIDLMTMSADDFLARWFEHSVTAPCSVISAQSAPSPAEDAGLRLCRPAPPHGRARRRGRLGFHPRRHGYDQRFARRIRETAWHGEFAPMRTWSGSRLRTAAPRKLSLPTATNTLLPQSYPMRAARCCSTNLSNPSTCPPIS